MYHGPTTLGIELVEQRMLTQYRRRVFKDVDGKLATLWDRYDEDRNVTEFLDAASHVLARAAGPLQARFLPEREPRNQRRGQPEQ